jgi:hypothetical protein
MKYSEDRLKGLALKIHDKLYLDELVDYTDEEESLACIKKTLLTFFALEDQIDDLVRQKIQTLKKNVPMGSPEWEILYQKYFEEELKKRHG